MERDQLHDQLFLPGSSAVAPSQGVCTSPPGIVAVDEGPLGSDLNFGPHPKQGDLAQEEPNTPFGYYPF